MIKAILTDLDGVIRHWRSETLFALEALRGLPKDAVFGVSFAAPLLQQAITGVISDPVWRETVAEQLAARYPGVDAAELVEAWTATTVDIDWDVLALYRNCYPQAQLILVTNATSRLAADLQSVNLHNSFDHIINSSEVGIAKPDRGIFEHALAVLGVSTVEALFIDDKPANVAAASALGIRSHAFTNIHGLHDFLTQRL